MATLPDLDTTSTGYIAYWNAIDQGGVGDIEADEVLSSGRVVSSTLYDNGVAGKVEGVFESNLNSKTRDLTFRVKEDGWFVVYIDRTNEYGTDFVNGDDQFPDGYYDVLNDWSGTPGEVGNASVSQNTLAEAINHLQQQLSNSGSIAFNYSDVGLYNYDYPSASTTTGFSAVEIDTGGGDFNFTYTSSTSLYYAAATGIADNDGEVAAVESIFEGFTLASVDSPTGAAQPIHAGTVDAIDQGLVPDPGTEYGHTLNMNFSDHAASGAVVVMWG